MSSDSVELKLSDGRSLKIPQAMSGSGARYANTDESFVFWNKGDTAFITEGKKEEAGLKSTLILSDNNKIPEKGVQIRVYTEGEGDKEVVTKILVLQKKAAP